ncbi:TetR/AcrR family transcriptional regulator [Nocardia sp. JW2]|uniref:TetR/AcrR family transcriptional regulator n=1 Tax=Nocardia sp. JW2 TaxID=3450738 RepID=UPI003F422662
MQPITNPLTANDDLTAKARIRNAALTLFASEGEARVTMRAVAGAAGVTHGLVQHYFKTKSGLRAACDQLVVDFLEQAVASAPTEGTPKEVAAARDAAVSQMFASNPEVANYLRRAILEGETSGSMPSVLDVVLDSAQRALGSLRERGVASQSRAESAQLLEVIVRQAWELIMQPLTATVWARISDEDGGHTPRFAIQMVDD